MSESPFLTLTWRERARRRSIAVALVFSALVHVAVMWQRIPQVQRTSSELADRSDGRSSLSVQLMPRASPPPAAPRLPAAQAEPAPKAPAQRARVVPRPPRTAPPVIAMDR